MSRTFASRSFGSRSWSQRTFGLGEGEGSGEQAVYYQCLTAAKTVIDALVLSGSPTVIVRKIPVDRQLGLGKDLSLPAIILAPQQEQMNPSQGVLSESDVPYGIWCVMVASDNQEVTLLDSLAQRLLWRQRISRAFRNRPLTTVTGIGTVKVEYGDVVMPEAWQDGLYASVLLLKFVSRESSN